MSVVWTGWRGSGMQPCEGGPMCPCVEMMLTIDGFPTGLTSSEKLVLAALRQLGPMSGPRLSKALGLPLRTIYRATSALRTQGHLRQDSGLGFAMKGGSE